MAESKIKTMKLILTILSVALGGIVKREVNAIDCPGRCWEKDSNDQCTPEDGKLTIDCSVVGHVKATVDACLFTPDNADYNQTYKVFTVNMTDTASTNEEVAGCFKEIGAGDDLLEFDWTYAQAADCGWKWDSAGDKLTFKNLLRPSENINKVTAQTIQTTISLFPEDIPLQCNFENHVSVNVDFSGKVSDATQLAEESEDISLAAGFSVVLEDDSDVESSLFTVGQQVASKFSYDNTAAGYNDTSQMPFGYFAAQCYVENKEDATEQLYLIGSAITDASGTADKCVMGIDYDSPLDLHISTSIEDSGELWFKENYTLRFDAFTFLTSTEMSLHCNFEICLKDECDAAAAHWCDPDIDECSLTVHNCHADAQCTNTVGTFDCSCNAGFEGNGVTCKDINECETGSHICDANATCENKDGGYKCDCNSGYTGDNGLSCANIDECATSDGNNCHANAACTDSAGSYSCSCNAGFWGNSEGCYNIDECGTNAHNCDANAICIDNAGSFTCNCKPGYTWNGIECT